MLRLIALLLLLPALCRACSCVEQYVPLATRICAAESADEVVLEVVVSGHTDDAITRVRVGSVVVGSNVPEQLRLRNGDSSFCGTSIANARRGERYLLLTDSASVASGEVRLFACGTNRTIYRMNPPGTQVEYPYITPASEGRPVGLKFQPFDPGEACTPDPGKSVPGPLDAISAYKNPGEGKLRLGVPTGVFPGLSSLEVFTSAGRRLAHFDLLDYLPNSVLDLTSLPCGYYLLIVSDGVYRRTLPYVITR